ncbi:MAG TPA: type II toxin-antitoxin system Phd/YefM family antitoxin [Chthoniobacterales bacterium]
MKIEPSPGIRSIPISEFKTHCTQALREVEETGVILHITRHGKVVAIIEPPEEEKAPTIAEWAGSGRGLMEFSSDYNPDESACAPEEWNAINGIVD